MKGKSGDEATSTKVPRLFLEMSWLRPFVQHRQTVSNMPSFEKVGSDDSLQKVVAEELSPSTPSPSTAPPSSSTGPTSDSEEDEQSSTIFLDDFGSSVLPRSSTPCKAATNSVMQPSLSSPPPVPCNKRKRKRDSADDGIGQLLSFLEKDKTDSFDRHAQIVADFMCKLPPRHCAIFKKCIQDIMFDTEMQLLDEQDNGMTHRAIFVSCLV
ncbi:hypothetical protein Q8A67_018785 [Cirrhinus molitorella]|uniref:Uncharacterized protein n=1 Tax=Cirrhinus molitorella TaxID=172907 RepID=A0AA88TGF3_9TELE|nr:hypothetical protein Q8A67_018785 [Cirrhinus molitorella]